MAFEGLQEQLKERWADISSRIQESPTFNNLREKFESQTPDKQRVIVAGAGLIIAMVLLMFPYAYYSASTENMTYFEENRELIQGLLRASRSAKTPSPLPAPIEEQAIKGRIEAVLNNARLLPEQIGDMQAIPGPAIAGPLVGAPVVQNGMAVQIKKINVKQIVELGARLQNMGNGLKLMGVDIVQSTAQTHYYDMIVRIVSFGLPQMSDADDRAAGSKRPNARPPPARKERTDEDLE